MAFFSGLPAALPDTGQLMMGGGQSSKAPVSFEQAWQGFNPTGNLSQGMLDYLNQPYSGPVGLGRSRQGFSPDGNWRLTPQYGGGNPEFGDQGTLMGYQAFSKDAAPGVPFYNYDAQGKFTGIGKGASDKGMWMTPLAAAIGMYGLGALGGFGQSAAGGAEALASGGAPSMTSFGTVFDPITGMTTVNGAPVFGAVDLAPGVGMGADGVATQFGIVDQGVEELFRSGALAPGTGVTPPDWGAIDAILRSNGAEGIPGINGGQEGSFSNPSDSSMMQRSLPAQQSFQQQLMSFLSSGNSGPVSKLLSSSFPSAFGKGTIGGSLLGAVGYGAPLMQLLAGLEGRKQSKRLQGQMQDVLPQVDEVQRGMQLPNPADITGIPGYQAGMEAVRRSLASQGYQGSGNMMAALQKYGGDFYDKYVNQRINSGNAQLNALRTKLGGIEAQSGPVSGNISSLALLADGVRRFL